MSIWLQVAIQKVQSSSFKFWFNCIVQKLSQTGFFCPKLCNKKRIARLSLLLPSPFAFFPFSSETSTSTPDINVIRDNSILCPNRLYSQSYYNLENLGINQQTACLVLTLALALQFKFLKCNFLLHNCKISNYGLFIVCKLVNCSHLT